MGQGKMKGQGAGGCADAGVSGDANPTQGLPMGRGLGFGWMGGQGAGRGGGHRRRCRGGAAGVLDSQAGTAMPEMNAEQEVDLLKRQAEHLRKAQEDVAKRIQDLETGQAD